MGYNYTNTPPGMPPEKGGGKTNWARIAAILSAAASAVAVLTWLGISGNSPTPTPVNTGALANPNSYSTTGATQATGSVSASPDPTDTAPNPVQSAGPPVAACRQALDAVTTFKNNAGTTVYSEQTAALRAYNEIAAAQSSAYNSGASTAIISDLTALASDFTNLSASARDNSVYNQLIGQINTDDRQLATDCGTD